MSYDLICMIYTLIYVAASIVVSLLIGRVIRTEIDQKMQDHDDNMAGVAKIPGRTECIRCGKRRTTETGNSTARGFVCHGCGRAAA